MTWLTCRVGDIAAPVRNALVGGPFGSDLVSKDYVDAGVPVIRGENLALGRWVAGEFVFVSEQKAAALAANTAGPMDLVFTQRGAYHYRQVALVPPDVTTRMLISQSQMKLTVNTSIADPLFVYYAFRAPQQQEYLRRHAIQTGVPHTNLGILRAVPLRLPPLAEQHRLVEILGALDDKIELNWRMNETLEGLVRTLYRAMMAASSAVHARSVYEIADVIYGAPFASADFNTECRGQPLIRIRDLRDESPEVFTTQIHPKGYRVGAGEIIVGMDGEFRPYLWGGPEGWLNQRVCAFRPKPGFTAAFVRESIRKPLRTVEDTETATTVIHLGKSDIDRFKIRVPEASMLTAFDRNAQPCLNRVVLNKQESRTLAQLRDTLLPQLLSGEIRVSTAEKEVAEAV